LEWAGLVAAGSGAGPGADAGAGADVADPGLALREVDLEVDRLLLAGGGFGSVRVATVPGDGGTRLQFEGEAIAGHLTLPGASRASLAGHFERLHWHRGEDAAAAPGESADEDGTVEQGPDPALIPPIRLSVGDLRLDQARLGNATLATSRIDGGMRIEQLETQSPIHHVVASGDWTGRGEAAGAQVDTRVASADSGRLLEGRGFQGRGRGGEGRRQMAATWPGSPAAFNAARLDAELTLSLRDGQLVEVE